MRIQVGAAALVGVTMLAASMAGATAAAGNTLRIDPASSSIAKDSTTTIKVIQSATVATSGAQVTLTFDKAKVQVVTVARGAPYASSTLFLGADATAIASANKSGKLKTVAAAFLPPASIATGDQEFLAIELKAIGCGQVKLGLPVGSADATMLDGRASSYAANLKVATTGATLTVTGCSDAGPGSSAPASSDSGAPTPTGEVQGETASPDPLASTDPGVVAPIESPAVEASPDTAAESPVPGTDAVPVASTSQQGDRDAWLDFAIAALAVAAVALALLIVVVIAIAMIGSLIALILLLRTRRPSGPAPEPAGGAVEDDGAPAGYDESPSAFGVDEANAYGQDVTYGEPPAGGADDRSAPGAGWATSPDAASRA
ncbi:MAG TPA: hypothetical protein VES19_07215 [Candidatus Limnocylindrales bacterium]|nr:hypothetical protein [Candidatus Limnocylindrales bacterium]